MSSHKDIKSLIIEGIQDRKGRGITVLDLSALDTAPAQTFIIAQGNSNTHVGSIAQNVEEHVRLNSGAKPYNADGLTNGQWIVIDYGDIWVHIFLPETRALYSLEDLWSDAKQTDIPDLD